MALAITNRGKLRILQGFFRESFLQTGFTIVLVTADNIPTVDTNLMSELTEIVAGNGYISGGVAISRDVIGFPTELENDAGDLSTITMKDVIFTASGGTLPLSGNGVKFAILADNNATLANREVFAFAEFTTVSILFDTQILSIKNLNFTLKES